MHTACHARWWPSGVGQPASSRALHLAVHPPQRTHPPTSPDRPPKQQAPLPPPDLAIHPSSTQPRSRHPHLAAHPSSSHPAAGSPHLRNMSEYPWQYCPMVGWLSTGSSSSMCCTGQGRGAGAEVQVVGSCSEADGACSPGHSSTRLSVPVRQYIHQQHNKRDTKTTSSHRQPPMFQLTFLST